MFGYPCPFCEQRLLAAPERAGQRTICPKCLKPIVIPKPEDEKKPEPPPPTAMDMEADEVPISMMPASMDDDATDATPLPEARPAARIGVAAGTVADPIPLKTAPAALHPAAAVLVRNPESVADLLPVGPPANEVSSPTPAPAAIPAPTPYVPPPSFPEPYFPPVSYPTAAPIPEPPSYPPLPTGFRTPSYPAVGRITGDHPAAALPPTNHNNTGGLIVFNPTDVEAANIAAELTQVISMKMRPAPEPPSDLRLTTCLWIILTACGFALWMFCMLSDMEPLKNVAIIGAVELVIGYLWVAIAFGHKGFKQFFTTLVPPVWVYRAANPPYEPGYRPLRFVVAGAILLSLYVIGPKVQPTIFDWIGFNDTSTQAEPDPIETPLTKLATAERDKNTLEIRRQLKFFVKSESLISVSATDKGKMIELLQRLTKHEREEVRADALRALVTWAQDDARPAVWAATRSPKDDEREAAYELISRWNDAETVQLLVNQVGGDTPQPQQALLLISKTERGRATIEEALVPKLKVKDSPTRDSYLALAAAYGSQPSLDVLQAQLAAAPLVRDRDPLPKTISAIKDRLRR